MFNTITTAAIAALIGTLVSTSAIAAEPGGVSALLDTTTLAVQLPGISHHFEKPHKRGREWNENNYGLGIEALSQVSETVYMRKSLGFMRDSLDMWSYYTGVTLQKRVVATPSWAVDGGAGLFLFYRAMRFDGPREWVPAPLPVLSAEHHPTGIGANLVFIPHIKSGNGNLPNTLYAQLTKSF